MDNFMLEELMLFILFVLFSICLVFVIVRWLFLAKNALEKGRIRVESMKCSTIDGSKFNVLQDPEIKYEFLK